MTSTKVDSLLQKKYIKL